MIKIKKSPTADTRTCDYAKVTKDELLDSSINHINDVTKALEFFGGKLNRAAIMHDHTKIGYINEFHNDFITGFRNTSWYEAHLTKERHHITTQGGLRDDVNLIDVLEHIADCVMAGMARSGEVYPIEIPSEILQKAVKNTVELLKSNVEVID